MPHVKYINVNTAFRELVRSFDPNNCVEGSVFVETDSRAGKVRQLIEPCIVTYNNPTQRVLFNQARDANPFFQLLESIWMLAGRNDVATLKYYNSEIANIASDDGKTFNGAYGYRWRFKYNWTADNASEPPYIDQLPIIIDQLKRKPESRRVVLQMWNVEDDLLKIDVTKDVCCNTAAYFAIQDGKLNMTVTNRSNDLIWGMLGANVVHFSILQEYLAAHIGVPVGVYHQFTNNLHVYTERFKPEEWLADTTPDWYNIEIAPAEPFPLVSDPKTFDEELYIFVEHCLGRKYSLTSFLFKEPFFQQVALPMALAYNSYKAKKWEEAIQHTTYIKAMDWKFVAHQWIQKRKERWLSQNPYNPQGVSDE